MYIFRGVSGSGKSTAVAKVLSVVPDAIVVSADNFFMVKGEYKFDPARLAEAHAESRRTALEACQSRKFVMVDNTNTQFWEIDPYLRIARDFDYDVTLCDVIQGYSDVEAQLPEFAKRNKHGVPLEVIQKQWKRYESLNKIVSLAKEILPAEKIHTLLLQK